MSWEIERFLRHVVSNPVAGHEMAENSSRVVPYLLKAVVDEWNRLERERESESESESEFISIIKWLFFTLYRKALELHGKGRTLKSKVKRSHYKT